MTRRALSWRKFRRAGPASRGGLEGPSYSDDEAPNNPRAVPQSVDVITEINGEPLTGISELIGYLAAETSPGDTVTLTVLRLDGETSEEVQLDVRLTPRP